MFILHTESKKNKIKYCYEYTITVSLFLTTTKRLLINVTIFIDTFQQQGDKKGKIQ